MAKWVYDFGDGKADGRAEMKNLLGGKGANLAEMASIGLPVPPGFTITTEFCTHFYQNGCQYPKELEQQVEKSLNLVESRTGRKFGDNTNPLLVSVRSGARASMPGRMMDTVLNLGLNDTTVEALAKKSGDRRFAFDSYRRFVQMYSDVVLGIEINHFEKHLERAKEKRGMTSHAAVVARGMGRPCVAGAGGITVDYAAGKLTVGSVTVKEGGIVEQDPFVSLDPDGVGELITMAVQRGRSTRPEMKMGICGEHGGDPASIEVCEKIGLDYVSCSPFRVPVARLAAAQSALKTKGEQSKQSSTKATKPRVQNFGPW
eukprot:Skav232652  [mRNA]  locus=scaffold2334:208151:213639:+ [translate_table: standard]